MQSQPPQPTNDDDDEDSLFIDFVSEDSNDSIDNASSNKQPTVLEPVISITEVITEKVPSPTDQRKDKTKTTTTDEDDADITNIRYRRVLKRIPHDIPYLPLTCEDGSRLYLRLKTVTPEQEEGSKSLMSGATKQNLINNWDMVKNEARTLVKRHGIIDEITISMLCIKNSRVLIYCDVIFVQKDKFHRELAKTTTGIFSTHDSENLGAPDSLWVEKYKPRSFLDLLSQEVSH